MDLKHLEYFAVVAQYGSINKAAQALFISQPHLSHIIKDLEADAGAQLLVRIPTGAALTPEGERFLQQSRKILEAAAEMRAMFRQKEEPRTTFRVSMTKSSHIMESFIDLCRQYEQTDAGFAFALNEGSPVGVVRDVADGTADLGVLHFNRALQEQYRVLLRENRLTYQPLSVYQPRIVLRAGHPLVLSGERVTPAALARYGFVQYIGHHEDFIYDIKVDGEGYDFAQSARIVSIYGRATLMHLISTTDFYTIGIRDFDCQQQVYNVVSLPIPDCQSELEFGYILPESAHCSPEAERFVQNLRQRLC